jgi:protein CMS1
MSDSEAEGGVPLIEPEFDTVPASNKRKRGEEPEDSKESKKATKKAKRKEKKKLRVKDIDEDDLDQKLGVNHAFERMDSQLLADYVNARTRLYGKDLSTVELEEMFLPGMYRSQDLKRRADKAKHVPSWIAVPSASHARWRTWQLFSRLNA